MDSNSSNLSFHERIIHSLFIKEKEKEKTVNTELNNYIYQYIIKNGIFNLEEFISNLLTALKNELFDESKEYRKQLEKDITPIIIIENTIKIYSKNSHNFFILLNPLFDMYKNLEPKKMIDFTNDIIKLLKEKKEAILKNFNELFEVIIYLLMHQDQSVKNAGNN